MAVTLVEGWLPEVGRVGDASVPSSMAFMGTGIRDMGVRLGFDVFSGVVV